MTAIFLIKLILKLYNIKLHLLSIILQWTHSDNKLLKQYKFEQKDKNIQITKVYATMLMLWKDVIYYVYIILKEST